MAGKPTHKKTVQGRHPEQATDDMQLWPAGFQGMVNTLMPDQRQEDQQAEQVTEEHQLLVGNMLGCEAHHHTQRCEHQCRARHQQGATYRVVGSHVPNGLNKCSR
jgi:hypothetical protein